MVSNYRTESELLYQLVQRVRPLSNQVETALNQRLEGTGLTTATRAVLERLATEGAATVPQIADALQVERQHVQRSVNTLLDEGLARRTPNPDHKRSMLVLATPKGKRLFKSVLKGEQEMLLGLSNQVKRDHVARADDVLAEMLAFFTALNRPEAEAEEE